MHRRLSRFAVAGILSVTPVSPDAQAQSPRKDERQIATPGGVLLFLVPAAWHVLVEESDEAGSRHVYHVRNPATDTTNDRTNVLVMLYRRSVSGDFKAFTDSAYSRMSDDSELLLDDHISSPDRRAMFWRGQLGAMPYIGFDNFARIDGYWLHVRIVSPLHERTTAEWSSLLSKSTGRLLATLTLGGRRVMNDDTGFPVLTSLPERAPPLATVGDGWPARVAGWRPRPIVKHGSAWPPTRIRYDWPRHNQTFRRMTTLP